MRNRPYALGGALRCADGDVILNQALDFPLRQIFITGASEAADTFLPDTIAKEFTGYRVNNISIDGANISEMQEVFAIIQSRTNLRKMNRPIFIIGAQYMSFLENERKFQSPLTQLDRERLRFHLYTRAGNTVVPVFPPPVMKAAIFLVRPFIWVFKFEVKLSDETDKWEMALLGRAPTPAEKKKIPNSFRAYVARLYDYKEGLPQGEFDRLAAIANDLDRQGAFFVYVDMPVRSHYRENFPIYDEYRRKLKATLVKNPAIHYMDMTSWAPDNQFYDEFHAKPEYVDLWATEITRRLKILAASAQPHT